MVDPIALDECNHSFCTVCIVDYEKKCSSEPATCPECKVPVGNVELKLVLKAKEYSRLAEEEQNGRAKATLLKHAVNCFDRLLKSSNPTPEILFLKAQVYIQAKRGDDALRTMETLLDCIRRYDEHPLITSNIREKVQDAEARGDCDAVMRLNAEGQRMWDEHGEPPQKVQDELLSDIHFNHGAALQLLRRWDEALEAFRKADSLQGRSCKAEESIGVCSAIAQCASKVGEYEAAIEACDRVLSQDPQSPGLYRFKALALKKLGKLNEALQILNDALLYETPLDPENAIISRQIYQELMAQRKASNA